MMSSANSLASLILFASFVRASIIPTSLDVVDLKERDTPPLYFADIFGPINAANNAPGLMASESLTTYDANACAQLCNTLAYNDTSGPCVYINIWQPTFDGTPVATICDMYNTVTDSSTATTTGQGGLSVSNSRGFWRTSNVADGSFQDYTCASPQQGCPVEISFFWTRKVVQDYDYVLINLFGYELAHSGNTSCFLFFEPPTSTSPAFGSTLTYTVPMNTSPGSTYIISFFYIPSTMEDTIIPTAPLFSVFWNNVDVLDIFQDAVATSFQFLHAQVEVVATGGQDQLFFKNGVSYPHNVYLDDIAVFPKWF